MNAADRSDRTAKLPRMKARGLRAAAFLVLGTLAAQACSSAETNPFPVGPTGAGAGGTTTPSGIQASTGIGGGLATDCTPACVAGQFCSVTGKCLANGTCADKEDCAMGLVCDAGTATCIPGSECGAQEETGKVVAPNLLIVLDRSCSMTKAVGGKPKWTIAVEALNAMMVTFKDQIRFGLTLFPDKVTPECGQSSIPFPPAAGNEPAMTKLLTDSLQKGNTLYPAGPCVTNIDTAMIQAQGEPALLDASRENFVMLVTDGEQSSTCMAGGGNKGTTDAIAALLGAKVKTFVVGFDVSGVSAKGFAALNTFADAGGAAINNGTAHFYDAADAASLDQALKAIAAATLGCTYKLDQAVADPNQLYVFFDNDPKGVPQDKTHMNGWDYEPATNSITFYGMACQDLKDAKVKDVDIVYGCGVPTPG
jgi:hypothetical protein